MQMSGQNKKMQEQKS